MAEEVFTFADYKSSMDIECTLDRLEEWIEENSKKNWKKQNTKNGKLIKTHETGVIRLFGIPFNVDIFLYSFDGRYEDFLNETLKIKQNFELSIPKRKMSVTVLFLNDSFHFTKEKQKLVEYLKRIYCSINEGIQESSLNFFDRLSENVEKNEPQLNKIVTTLLRYSTRQEIESLFGEYYDEIYKSLYGINSVNIDKRNIDFQKALSEYRVHKNDDSIVLSLERLGLDFELFDRIVHDGYSRFLNKKRRLADEARMDRSSINVWRDRFCPSNTGVTVEYILKKVLKDFQEQGAFDSCEAFNEKVNTFIDEYHRDDWCVY